MLPPPERHSEQQHRGDERTEEDKDAAGQLAPVGLRQRPGVTPDGGGSASVLPVAHLAFQWRSSSGPGRSLPELNGRQKPESQVNEISCGAADAGTGRLRRAAKLLLPACDNTQELVDRFIHRLRCVGQTIRGLPHLAHRAAGPVGIVRQLADVAGCLIGNAG